MMITMMMETSGKRFQILFKILSFRARSRVTLSTAMLW